MAHCTTKQAADESAANRKAVMQLGSLAWAWARASAAVVQARHLGLWVGGEKDLEASIQQESIDLICSNLHAVQCDSGQTGSSPDSRLLHDRGSGTREAGRRP